MPIDWAAVEQDVLDRYVDQNWTAGATISYLKSQHSLEVSIKQFKSKYGGHKKATAGEWAETFRRVEKRQLEGKESEVYLNGRPVNTKRLKREMIRYGKRPVQSNHEETKEMRFLSIRTPPPTTQPISTGVLIDDPDTEVIPRHSDSQESADPVIGQGLMSTPRSFSRSFLHDVTTPASMVSNASIPRYIGHEAFFHDLSLPCTQLRQMLGCHESCSITFSASWDSRPRKISLSLHAAFTRPGEEALQFANFIPHTPWYPVEYTSLYNFGGLEAGVLFELLAYLISNNFLDARVTATVLLFIKQSGASHALVRFLQLRGSTLWAATTSETFLQAAIHTGSTELAKVLYEKGARIKQLDPSRIDFDGLRPKGIQLLSKIHPAAMRGEIGGRLLFYVVRAGRRESASILIKNGADVNYKSAEHGTTPLVGAIERGKINMVAQLIQHGADVNLPARRHDRLSDSEVDPISQALRYKKHKILDYLLEHGARPPNIFSFGCTDRRDIFRNYDKLREKGLSSMAIAQLGIDQFRDIALTAQNNPEFLDSLVREKQLSHEDLEKALLYAVAIHKVIAVSRLLAYGVNPNLPALRKSGVWPKEISLLQELLDGGIFYRVDRAKKSICYLLLKSGADVPIGPFTWFNEREQMFLISLFVQAGLDLSKWGSQLVERAAHIGDLQGVIWLLDQFSPLDSDKITNIALQAAAWGLQNDVAEYLLGLGGDVNAPVARGRGQRAGTALQGAAAHGNERLMKLLLEVGADPNATSAKQRGSRALERAVNCHDKDAGKLAFDLLIKAGAVVDQLQGGHDVNIVGRLIENGWTESLQLILDKGFSVDHMNNVPEDSNEIRDKLGRRTPLQVAAEVGNLEILDMLLHRGANINAGAHPIFGRTALQAATSDTNPKGEFIQQLLDRGADIHAPAARKGGVTALQGTAASGNISIAQMLISRGANVNEPPAEEEGMSALQGAVMFGRLDMVHFLLNLGSDGGGRMRYIETMKIAQEKGYVVIGQILYNRFKTLYGIPTV